MKKIFTFLTIVLLGAGLTVSCESLKLGDEGLSKAPETSGATLDTLFASLKDADKVLTSAYYYLPYGLVTSFDKKMNSELLEAITDHYVSKKTTEGCGPINLYYSGGLSASLSGDSVGGEAYRFGGRASKTEKDYTAIRYAWFFLENADRIPDGTKAEIDRKKAEAKMCMAIAYANMFRYVGGVPLLDHAIMIDEDLNFPRNTFAETVEFIVKLCDEAAKDLPWYVSQVENGRLTKAAALGLKLRILCFAASPTFNSDTPWHPDAADWEKMGKYVRYGQKYDATLWTRAKDAANEFMSAWATNGYYGLEQAVASGKDPVSGLPMIVPRDYRLAYRKGYFNRESTECIISIHKSNSTSYHDNYIDVIDDYTSGASLEWVNRFPWADGTPFPSDFDWSNPPREPFFEPDPTGTLLMKSTPMKETRDPRLYENVCAPGDKWKNGSPGKSFYNHWNNQGLGTGFIISKYVLQENADRAIPPHWCMMRLPEVFLNAAEAYNEADGGPSPEAYAWVNAVRNRVGLPNLAEDMTKEEFRNAILLERDLEFGFEEVRWFDMVRWGLKEAFTTKLHGLISWGDDDRNPTRITYGNPQTGAEPVYLTTPTRKWYTEFDTKWYLCPIPTEEIQKGYGMTQNPGW